MPHVTRGVACGSTPWALRVLSVCLRESAQSLSRGEGGQGREEGPRRWASKLLVVGYWKRFISEDEFYF